MTNQLSWNKMFKIKTFIDVLLFVFIRLRTNVYNQWFNIFFSHCKVIVLVTFRRHFDKNTHTGERNKIKIDEREKIQDFSIDTLLIFTLKILLNEYGFLTEIYDRRIWPLFTWIALQVNFQKKKSFI